MNHNSVTVNSGEKALWTCSAGHEWTTTVNKKSKGNGCPYCAVRRSTSTNRLATLNPDLTKERHDWFDEKTGMWWQHELVKDAGAKEHHGSKMRGSD